MTLIALALLAAAMQDAPCPTVTTVEAAECRAQLAYALGQHEEAARAFEEMASLSDDPAAKARALAAAAPLHSLSGDVTAALAAVESALATGTLEPVQQGWSLLDKVQYLVRLDRQGEAEIAWAVAGALVDADPYFWLVGGQLALDRSDIETARARVDAGLGIAGDSPELLLLSGQVSLAAEDIPAARQAFAAAAQAMPDHHAAKAAARALSALPQQ